MLTQLERTVHVEHWRWIPPGPKDRAIADRLGMPARFRAVHGRLLYLRATEGFDPITSRPLRPDRCSKRLESEAA